MLVENVHGDQQQNAEVHEPDICTVQAEGSQTAVKENVNLPRTEASRPAKQIEGLPQIPGPDEEPTEGQNQEGAKGLEQPPTDGTVV